MYSTLISVALFASLAIQGVLSFAVSNPPIAECKSVKITWEATKAPYNVALFRSNDTCGDPLVDLGDTNKTFLTWPAANFTKGTQLVISILDGNDNEALSHVLTVADGDSTCLSGAKNTSTASTSSTGSTLVVPPAANAAGTASTVSTAPAAPTESGASAVGASSGGVLGSNGNGAFTSVPLSLSTLALGAVVAVLGIAL